MEKKVKNLNEKMDDLRWAMFSIEERLEKLEKNVNIEYRDRIKELENWKNKLIGDDNVYNELNNRDFENEKEKYMRLYDGDLAEWYRQNKSDGRFLGYGCENWGSGMIKYIKKIQPKSLLDVGCGIGQFCVECLGYVKNIYGLDIASVKTKKVLKPDKIDYLDAEIKYIPLEDNEVEWVTGFDVLEHIPEYDIDKCLDELDRVSEKGMIFSISFDKCDYQGIIIHKIIKSREWWIEKLKEYGEVQLYGTTPYVDNKYIIVYKDNISDTESN